METSLDNKTVQLQNLVTEYESVELLKFIAFILMNLGRRDEDQFLLGLLSPQRQLFYLANLCVQQPLADVAKKKAYTEPDWPEEWMKLKTLLIDIETEYNLLFAEEAKIENSEILVIAAQTFINYFYNGELAFDEQEIERIERTFKDSGSVLERHLGFDANDFVRFYHGVIEFVEQKLNDIILPMSDPRIVNCMEDFHMSVNTSTIEVPEEVRAIIENYFIFLKDPGKIFILRLEDLESSSIGKKKLELILDLLTCEPSPKEEIIYYTSTNILLTRPIIKISDGKYLIFFGKQILNAGYQKLLELLKTVNGVKALKARDKLLEEKTAEIFGSYFKKNAHIYRNYSIDKRSEQDILILSKNLALIIETKAGGYREPMRDPEKAYNKIKSDFNKTIQYGYDQAARVETLFKAGTPFKIWDMNKKELQQIQPKKFDEVYTLVVTQERFGFIQIDLSILLEIKDDYSYPWSICVDDLEVFFLALRKKSPGTALFRSYLNQREKFHGRLVCGDELETCALFLQNPNLFKSYSDSTSPIVFDPRSTSYFEFLYKNGLGFKKERYYSIKKEGKVGFPFWKQD